MAIRKNDRVIAVTTVYPLIGFGKQYTVLGVRTLPSGEILLRISTDQHKKQYVSADYFRRADEELRKRLTQENL